MNHTSPDDTLADAARGYALEWPVLPLKAERKEPATAHGKDDATTDPDQIREWWNHNPRYNIGVRPPVGYVVLDVDPRNGGTDNLIELIDGRRMPETWMTRTGSGGWHIWLKAYPPFRSTLCKGVDIKYNTGYVVMPPSVHPNGRVYRWVNEHPIAYTPVWLLSLMRPPVRKVEPASSQRISKTFDGESIADEFSNSVPWTDILEPHGWRCTSRNPDADGARWLHPTATSECSATIKNGCLFVYSTNTPFDVTESGNPNGYTRFRAYAVLNHGGDMKAAARALSERRSK
jgi:hypothetical protein